MDKAQLTELHARVADLNTGHVITGDRNSDNPSWFRTEVASILESLITAVETLGAELPKPA